MFGLFDCVLLYDYLLDFGLFAWVVYLFGLVVDAL